MFRPLSKRRGPELSARTKRSTLHRASRHGWPLAFWAATRWSSTNLPSLTVTALIGPCRITLLGFGRRAHPADVVSNGQCWALSWSGLEQRIFTVSDHDK
jgi:hypothetical protein